MNHNVLAPNVGESITEVSILKWSKNSGDSVSAGEVILEIESEKATVEVVAESDGAITILKQEGETVPVGEILASIDDAVKGKASAVSGASTSPSLATPTPPPPPPPMANASLATTGGTSGGLAPLSPAVRKAVVERGLNPSEISGTGKDGRLTKGDVLGHTGVASSVKPAASPVAKEKDRPGDKRVPMTPLRKKIASRLVEAQQTAAILTTFNEVDMTAVNSVRSKYKESFKTKHGVPLSFMSFFTRACVESLKEFPAVNAFIDGTDVVYHEYFDIGIAVGTERGLVVPVLRDVGKKGFLEIEQGIGELAKKARTGKLSIADMSGGTFTISNGGTYGSMMSTPILNPPQSAILGMHAIINRPIVVEGKIEIRPMMYLALSYDHRIIDGKEAVTFLVGIKNRLENPEELGKDYTDGL